MKLRSLCVTLALLLLASTAHAQTTIIIGDTHHPGWQPSPDEGQTFGTPPQQLVTDYIGEIFLKADVSNGVPNPATTPKVTLHYGIPPQVSGIESGPPIKPSIVPGQEYWMFLSAIGPGGTSPRSTGVGPFGLPGPPAAVPTGSVKIIP